MKLLHRFHSSHAPARGFTLVESLMAMGLSGLVTLALTSVLMFTGKTFTSLFNYVDLNASNQTAMDIMTRDIRTANRLVSFAAKEFTLEDANGFNLTYRYNPGDRTVSRVTPTGARVLLKDCERFSFNICQRTPEGGNYEVFPTADAQTAKVIDLSWMCYRTILGYKSNTESVQTARIVIRRQGQS